jgi:hypothetical protein
MSQAAKNLLASLPPEQRRTLVFPFDDPERRVWHYTPGPRPGVSLAEMDREAAKAVHRLLSRVVSPPTHTRVAAITGLEDVLDESEGGWRGRHAGDYWTAVFGDPGGDCWAWRFEGHHVSINVTLAEREVSATPWFLGANPATVTDDGGRTVSRPLAPEEDLAVALAASLDAGQQGRAVISGEAPPDILSGEAADVSDVAGLGPGGRGVSPRQRRPEPPWNSGLPAAALRPDQVTLLRALASVYVGRLEQGLAEPHLARLDRDLSSFCFAWAGATGAAAGQPRYYRLEGPRFLVEFDNRQNGANHVHSVWRDPGGDFGARLLP